MAKELSCESCDRKFTNKKLLKWHQKTHTIGLIYPCSTCKMRFSTRARLGEHKRTQHVHKDLACDFQKKSSFCKMPQCSYSKGTERPRQYNCELCEKSFRYMSNLKSHSKLHTGQKDFVCVLCAKKFARRSHLQKHMVGIHEIQRTVDVQSDEAISALRSRETPEFKCDFCSKKFATKRQLNVHRRVHTVGDAFACNYCDKECYSKAHLEVHVRCHTGERPFKCHLCNQTFTCKSNLLCHIKFHSGVLPHKCPLCDQNFGYYKTLKKHMLKEHPEEIILPDCFENNTFSVSGVLRKKSSTFDVQYLKSLEESSLGKDHQQKSRLDERKKKAELACEFCDRLFSKIKYLNAHRKVHFRERKLHVCDFCNRHCYSHAHLAVHRRTHTGEMPFQCKLCGKRFVSGSNLVRHERIHTGPTKFQCQFCRKTFCYYTSLKSHTNVHLGQAGFECEHCGRRFKRQSDMMKHLSGIHGKQSLSEEKYEPSPETAKQRGIHFRKIISSAENSLSLSDQNELIFVEERTDSDTQKTGSTTLGSATVVVEENQLFIKQMDTGKKCDESGRLSAPEIVVLRRLPHPEGESLPVETFPDNMDFPISEVIEIVPDCNEIVPTVDSVLTNNEMLLTRKFPFNNNEIVLPRCEITHESKEILTTEVPNIQILPSILLMPNTNDNEILQTTENKEMIEPVVIVLELNEDGSTLVIPKKQKAKKTFNKQQLKFQCEFCEKKFYAQCHLDIHRRAHTGDRPFRCDICGKAYSEERWLKDHATTHTGELPFECGLCGKSFRRAALVKLHLKRHIGQYNFACDLCEKRYFTRQELKQHSDRCHATEKKFACDLCEKGFASATLLKTHQEIHKGQPFDCDKCQQQFVDLSSLRRHKAGVHPARCEVCKKHCGSQKALLKHTIHCLRKSKND